MTTYMMSRDVDLLGDVAEILTSLSTERPDDEVLPDLLDRVRQAAKSRTEVEIVEQTNELARMLFRFVNGMIAPAEHQFWNADERDVRSSRAWAMACEIQEFFTATDAHDALANMLGEEQDAEDVRSAIDTAQLTANPLYGTF